MEIYTALDWTNGLPKRTDLFPYRITFTIAGTTHQWIRFAPNMEAYLSEVKSAIAKEWPGRRPLRVCIESPQEEKN
jgi:hypothetical protein